ncbi:uncharacterized protein LOC107621434 [Arachis ipaensis]|uniref:uncharacterized protein LOC107621434 n=1 Tax=Arachis ipaensis TaxID=130454 RepID=UPI0007AFCA65|nr:uncharacterized protein LOC107621434 [Arachis ipaensis]
MVSDESFVALVHYRGSIKKKTRSGIKFTDKDPLSVFLKLSTSFDEFKNTILKRLGLHGVKRVKLFYRIPIFVLRDDVKYDSFVISSDEDLQVLFHCRRQFPEVRTPELLVKLVDMASSFGGSNRDLHSTGHLASSSAMPVGSSSAVPVIAPEPDLVASPSFALTTIADDNDDETPRTTPPMGGGASSSGGVAEFQFGQQFQDKEEVVFSVKTYSIRRGVEYKVLESDHRKYYGKCKEFRSAHGSSGSASTSTKVFRRADAAMSIKVLQNATEAHFGFRPTYRKITMPGSVAVLKTSPVRVGGQLDDSTAYFHRLFWTFPPCVEAFRHCKSLVSVDGTHLYGKYGGTLLIAIVQDGNSNSIPIAFALVEGENAESWSFFLSHLRTHVTPQSGILVISDRHNGIKAALEAPDGGWLPSTTYRAFCIRHVAANFALTFKGKDARRLLVNAVYAKTEVEFQYWFDILFRRRQYTQQLLKPHPWWPATRYISWKVCQASANILTVYRETKVVRYIL